MSSLRSGSSQTSLLLLLLLLTVLILGRGRISSPLKPVAHMKYTHTNKQTSTHTGFNAVRTRCFRAHALLAHGIDFKDVMYVCVFVCYRYCMCVCVRVFVCETERDRERERKKKSGFVCVSAFFIQCYVCVRLKMYSYVRLIVCACTDKLFKTGSWYFLPFDTSYAHVCHDYLQS